MRSPAFIMAIALIALLIGGCTGQAQAPTNSSASPQPPAAPPAQQWAHYSNIGMSFDYPAGMGVNESLESYPQSAIVVVQSRDAAVGAIIVEFMNATVISNLTIDPIYVATGILDYDNSSGGDMLLSQADATSAMTNFTSPGGLAAAEMRFTIPSGNLTLYGVALELYDQKGLVSYPVRIVSSDPNQTRALRDRFVDTFRSG
jgi:hypothetical protein